MNNNFNNNIKRHLKNAAILFGVVLILSFLFGPRDLSTITSAILIYLLLIDAYLLIGVLFNNSFKVIEKIINIIFFILTIMFMQTPNILTSILVLLIPIILYTSHYYEKTHLKNNYTFKSFIGTIIAILIITYVIIF
ncbi:hypothetical protein MBBAR_3c01000 [Methanobrevibacter arboriphilus JCM 13429 = DSM 1125]|uniref:Uncharacterized protein n=1 Tax=Methanobrevibacter arboriphilus JCM 13429 = DSM 1125 TaxID=1300164 RepID=A0A1V6N445_METAZ|nr:hypothetical protein [Methanobrevibacter arboriphilus]OQD59444.1 hypothetical protein MBBAR_3c01000 [Methanobrevibacter arboriphilus JCM 13429 = DSM 1125]